ncbi:CobW family GTP-binding protein [Desertibacillus haloalkaliphilus]|uniref:CobW family GTP-binding protein n=1 Tax=Desertibacillus haloalkaliphilus TaxID=1328930 RepID=UPI001C260F53|nr:GTP-binding protein [Desertibacillus haloalkaliphilus]MBU8908812.1 GTP-binding protein [Desertibacillus haloalkaliphilus]
MGEKKIPVYLITGFLGSGKTTVLMKVLKELKEKNMTPGIVLNELGEVNVERDLFENEPLLEMLNGCICCTIREDLTKELETFITTVNDHERPDALLIEGTGVANPREIVEAITSPALFEELELKSIVSLIDASHYLEYQSIFSSSKEIRTVLKQQLTNGTLILLNKVDLISAAKLVKVRKKVRSTVDNERVSIFETSYGDVDVEEILKPRVITKTVDGDPQHKDHSSHHHHDHDHHVFQTIKIDTPPVLDRTNLEKWLKGLPEHVIRAKGMIQLKETPGYFQFQFSSNQLSISRIDQKKLAPCIIIIGHSIDATEIEQSFQRLVLG